MQTKDKAANLRMSRRPFRPELMTLNFPAGSAKEMKREMREAAFRDEVPLTQEELDFFTNNIANGDPHTHRRPLRPQILNQP